MRKIDYNLATSKRIKQRVFMPVLLMLFGGALLISWIAGHELHRFSQRIENEKKLLHGQEQKIANLEGKQRELERLIGQKKPSWEPRIDFCNQLISRKTYSFCQRLDFLENILPAEIFIEKLSLSNGNPNINCSLLSPSFAKMREAYRKLSAYGMSALGEYDKDGIWYSNLIVRYTDEKK